MRCRSRPGPASASPTSATWPTRRSARWRSPGAAGKRYLVLADGPSISYLEIAGILRRRLGTLAARVPTQEAPGDDLPRPVIHNDRAREELGFRPRTVEATIVDSAQSLRELGLLDDRDQ